ncbi:MAG: SbcC/MukB-like Walker B domain-containing protein [Geobacteraceae bacterium]
MGNGAIIPLPIRSDEEPFRQLKILIEANKSLATDIPKIELKAAKQITLKTEIESLLEHNLYVATKDELIMGHQDMSSEVANLKSQLAENNIGIRSLGNQVEQFETKKKDLRGKCISWDETAALRNALENKYAVKFTTDDDVSAYIGKLVEKEKEAFGNKIVIEQEIKALDTKILDYISRQSNVDQRLEKLAKDLGGKLVISFYENLEIDEAAEKEARLGPLVNAIMVDDVQVALRAIEQMNDKVVPEEVWLIEKSRLDNDVLRFYKKVGRSIVAQMDKAWRITRFPDCPKVGHLARQQMIADLRNEKEKKRELIKQVQEVIEGLQEEIAKLHTLAGRFSSLEEKNPYEVLADLEVDINQCKEQIAQADFFDKLLSKNLESKSNVLAMLGKLLPDAYLLDDEDLSLTLTTMKELLQQVEVAKTTYAAKKDLFSRFDRKMYVLRVTPPSEDECAKLRNELTTHKADWEFWSTASDTLTQLIGKIEHFKFEKSFEQLQASEDPAPELRKQQDRVSRLLNEERNRLKGLQEAEALANTNYTQAMTAHASKQANIEYCELRLNTLGVDSSEKSLDNATTTYNKVELELNQLTEQHRQVDKAFPSISFSKDAARDGMKDCKKKWLECKSFKYEPARLAWEDTKAHCQSDKALTRLLQITVDRKPAIENTDTAFVEAITQRRLLDNLIRKQPVLEVELQPYIDTLLAAFDGFPGSHDPGKDQLLLQKYLALWNEVVIYISQILPRDCVYTDNPEVAIEQMNNSYKSLSETLEQQEKDFQMDSDSVANSIKSKIQTARSSIRKHNALLDGMSFGNIKGIMIDFTLHEDMVQILDVMQNKDQWDLFDEDIPLHEVMKKIYSHKVGGTVQGDELLDYKKYIKLTVKIQRKSSHKWETSFMSTGEAIGTGAAILMVILMSWENSASFFRDRDHRNSMRFLFMDEATRLDKESIKTLLDFCKKLEIQFVLAGPKFEAEECGDGTTYKLERINLAGREHVLVRGRKGFGGNRLPIMAGDA